MTQISKAAVVNLVREISLLASPGICSTVVSVDRLLSALSALPPQGDGEEVERLRAALEQIAEACESCVIQDNFVDSILGTARYALANKEEQG